MLIPMVNRVFGGWKSLLKKNGRTFLPKSSLHITYASLINEATVHY